MRGPPFKRLLLNFETGDDNSDPFLEATIRSLRLPIPRLPQRLRLPIPRPSSPAHSPGSQIAAPSQHLWMEVGRYHIQGKTPNRSTLVQAQKSYSTQYVSL